MLHLAIIAKTPVTPAVFYFNKTVVIYLNDVAVIYLDETVVIYFNEAANLLELENQRGVRFLRPEIFKRFGGIAKEAINRLIYPGVNKEP